MSRTLPRYPVYVPSKGRWQHARAMTVRMLLADEVPFRVVVQPQEVEQYAQIAGEENVLVLPFSDDARGLMLARNWIMDHAIAEGHERHWQLDDNIRVMRRFVRGRRIPVAAGIALRVVEDFSDRYTNVALSGLNYQMFVTPQTVVPYYLNVHVYSCTLVNNAIPYRWRIRYNDDTDICLQALSGGWCTILVNAFMCDKMRTMTTKGGNTADLYQGDGRLTMARELERKWPGVVRTERRFQRPQHVIANQWKRFDTALIPREGFDPAELPERDEYGLELRAVKEVRSERLRRMLTEK